MLDRWLGMFSRSKGADAPAAPTVGVAGEEPPDDKPAAPADPDSPEEVEKYQQEAQAFIDSRKNLLVTFAQDISLRFKMGEAFFIDLENGVVNLDTRWFRDRGYSKEQILWAIFHEIAHFRDLVEDKEVVKNFEYIRAQAKKTGAVMMKKWEETFGQDHPEVLEKLRKQKPIGKKHPNRTMNAVELAAFKFHHLFFNSFDDINVNARVSDTAPAYGKGRPGGEAVERLYTEKLFPKSDYANLPRHMQLVYKLLREEMVPGEETAVSEEVQEVLDRQIIWQGRKYTAKQLVEKFIKPKKGQNTKAGSRYFMLKKTLEPLFEELLLKDLADWKPELPPPPQESKDQKDKSEGDEDGEPGEEGSPEANPFAGEYKNYDANSPDRFNDEDAENVGEKHQADQEAKKRAKAKADASPEDKAKAAAAAHDADWCKRTGTDAKVLEEFRAVQAEVAPYVAEFAKLWHSIIHGGSNQTDTKMVGYYHTGTVLDIPRVISHSPGVVSNNPAVALGAIEQSRDMKRQLVKTKLVRKPELIRVRLLGDVSVSMDAKKRHILQQCFVLILSSLDQFNTQLNFARTRKKTKSKLRADTEAWIFGEEAKKVKSLQESDPLRDPMAEIVRIVTRLGESHNYTYDHMPLQEVVKEIPAHERKLIASGKILDIVLEITDGGSSDVDQSRQAVGVLLDNKIVARAFQIGNVTKKEKEAFDEVWNNGREEPLGEVVGEEIANLLPAVVEALKQYLGAVRL